MLRPELSANAAIVNRFFNEARATTLIKHPGLVDIFDFGHLPGGAAFIIMEFLEGESLTARIRRERMLSPALIVELGRQAAAALGAAHEKGIIHRDIKPDNIFIVPDPGMASGLRIKLLDFGIAKLVDDSGVGARTNTGAIMGTPLYMSPEQCRGAGQVDLRTDIYALGCVMFEMACGRPPFVGQGAGEIIAAHIYEEPPAARTLAPSLPEALEGVIARALEESPADRPQSMAELGEELDRCLAPAGGGFVAAARIEKTPSAPLPKGRAAPGAMTALEHVAPTTTLGNTAGELSRSAATPAQRRPRVAALVAIVGAVGGLSVGGVVWMRSGGQPRAVAAATPVALPKAPPPTPVITKLSDSVRLTIASNPSGAAIFRPNSDRSIGATPLEVAAERGSGSALFTVRLAGYHEGRIALDTDEDGTATARLVPLGKPAAKVASAPLPKPPAETIPAAPTAKQPDNKGLKAPRGFQEPEW